MGKPIVVEVDPTKDIILTVGGKPVAALTYRLSEAHHTRDIPRWTVREVMVNKKVGDDAVGSDPMCDINSAGGIYVDEPTLEAVIEDLETV